jgi:hypothetical protein
VGSVAAVAVHSAGSSATMVAAFACWVSASVAVTIAYEIKGAAFALAFVSIHLW